MPKSRSSSKKAIVGASYEDYTSHIIELILNNYANYISGSKRALIKKSLISLDKLSASHNLSLARNLLRCTRTL